MTYKKLNNLIGWVVFAIATTVYILTMEPSASWWDCGEYIATSYKLEVGHPPGAPLFQLIGRFFSLFAPDVTNVSMMINLMSAVCSGFTILFLFWSITMLAKKIVIKDGEFADKGSKWAVLGAGLIGALSYTFTDSFWFSAVEGEVYAMSSFFTALAFWSILKWNECTDESYAIRWIIFIAFQIGLSIGVHLLNLLTVPAIVYIYYFKKYKVTPKGFIYAGLISLAIVAFILNGIVPETVSLFAGVEIYSVNSLGLPFNVGTIILALLIISFLLVGVLYTVGKIKSILPFTILGGILGLLIILDSGSFGGFIIRFITIGILGYLIYKVKNNKFILSAGILSMTFILIGYTSFLTLVIRANTNTPVNENAPEDAVSLLSYLNREQYGSWPLLYGPYYNAPIDQTEDWSDLTPLYVKDKVKKKYVITDPRKGAEPVYEKEFSTIFPRMHSKDERHIRQYKAWADVKGVKTKTKSGQVLDKPTFGENLKFFMNYQINHMYFRYLMWNFSGRQNNIENPGGSVMNGNWITGWDWFDTHILGLPTMNNLPASLDNPAHNKFYMIPFILGIIGLIYQIKRDQKNAFVVGLLFIMTGLAIIVYLNQKPMEPRERDYAYAGSFYAYAIWIGLAVLAIWEFLRKKINTKIAALLSILVCAPAPYLLATQGWDDHDRSHRTAARDMGANYLQACAPNSIIMAHGDNDTFPLWNVQEVEGVRTDVRVMNFMLAASDWYCKQMANKVYESEPVQLTLTPAQYEKGVNDIIFIENNGKTVSIMNAIKYIADERTHRNVISYDTKHAVLPASVIRIPVDTAAILASGMIPERLRNKVVPYIDISLKNTNAIYKNSLLLLDVIASNKDWTRPIYSTNPTFENFDLDKYMHLEGVSYRFLPVPAEHYHEGFGGINADKSYDVLMNQSKWGNLNDPRVKVDRESARNVMVVRQYVNMVAEALIAEGKNDKAITLIDACNEWFPLNKIYPDRFVTLFLKNYIDAGAKEKAQALAEKLIKQSQDELAYYFSQDPQTVMMLKNEYEDSIRIIYFISDFAKESGSKEIEQMAENAIDEAISRLRMVM